MPSIVSFAFTFMEYYLCLIRDVGVIVAAVLIWQTHHPARFYADPAVSLFISLIIFASAVPLSACSPRVTSLSSFYNYH